MRIVKILSFLFSLVSFTCILFAGESVQQRDVNEPVQKERRIEGKKGLEMNSMTFLSRINYDADLVVIGYGYTPSVWTDYFMEKIKDYPPDIQKKKILNRMPFRRKDYEVYFLQLEKVVASVLTKEEFEKSIINNNKFSQVVVIEEKSNNDRIVPILPQRKQICWLKKIELPEEKIIELKNDFEMDFPAFYMSVRYQSGVDSTRSGLLDLGFNIEREKKDLWGLDRLFGTVDVQNILSLVSFSTKLMSVDLKNDDELKRIASSDDKLRARLASDLLEMSSMGIDIHKFKAFDLLYDSPAIKEENSEEKKNR
jgi:hypothetical protein